MDFFATPALMWGALAAGIPVLIHLTGRTKPVPHLFPAMRFLARSQRTSTRIWRIKHLLLLLMRMLLLGLLAFTFARPKLPAGIPESSALRGSLKGDYVLVLDASLSMNARVGSETHFERAKQQAARFMELLAPDSRAALFLATEEPLALQSRLTLDHSLVTAVLSKSKATSRSLDLPRVLTSVSRVLERGKNENRSGAIVFFTDFQKSSVLPVSAMNPGGGAPRVILVDCGADKAENGGIVAARLPNAVVPADQPMTLNVRVNALDSRRSFPIELYLDGAKIAQQQGDPQGASEVETSFTFLSGGVGAHEGHVLLPQNDALPQDSTRYFSYLAGNPQRALIVERTPAAQDAVIAPKPTGYYLRAALGTKSAMAATGLAVDVCGAKELDAPRMAGNQIVILADPGRLSDAQWEALTQYTEQGGGLMVWLGDGTEAGTYGPRGYSEFAKFHGLLPGKLGNFQRPGRDRFLTLKVDRPDHALFERFPLDVLNGVKTGRVYAHWNLAVDPKDSGTSVVLGLNAPFAAGGLKDSPWLLEKSFGQGRVILIASGPVTTEQDLPRQGELFVSLVLEACRFLSGPPEMAEGRLGRQATLQLTDPPYTMNPDGFVKMGVVQYLPPDEKEEQYLEPVPPRIPVAPLKPALGADPVKSGPRFATLFTPSFEEPGIHRFFWKPGRSETAPPRSVFIAVNPATNESDLTRAKVEEVQKALAVWKPECVKDVYEAASGGGPVETGRERSGLLLVMLLMLVLAECFFAARMQKKAV